MASPSLLVWCVLYVRHNPCQKMCRWTWERGSVFCPNNKFRKCDPIILQYEL